MRRGMCGACPSVRRPRAKSITEMCGVREMHAQRTAEAAGGHRAALDRSASLPRGAVRRFRHSKPSLSRRRPLDADERERRKTGNKPCAHPSCGKCGEGATRGHTVKCLSGRMHNRLRPATPPSASLGPRRHHRDAEFFNRLGLQAPRIGQFRANRRKRRSSTMLCGGARRVRREGASPAEDSAPYQRIRRRVEKRGAPELYGRVDSATSRLLQTRWRRCFIRGATIGRSILRGRMTCCSFTG